MDLAFVAEVAEEREVFRFVQGEAERFGVIPGASRALVDTICNAVLAGRVPNAIPDVRALGCDLAVASEVDIGAYIGVALRLSDARLYMLCCLAGESRPRLDEADVRFLLGLGETIAATLESSSRLDQDGE